MDEVLLTAEEADPANAIKTVDARLDELAERERRMLGFGMRAGRADVWSAHQAEDRLDERRATLAQQRADLTARPRRQVEGDRPRRTGRPAEQHRSGGPPSRASATSRRPG